MAESAPRYVPAAGHDWFLPLYDPVLRFLFHESELRRRMLEGADLRPGHRLLDVGAGTGSFAVLVARTHPDVRVTGVDGDPKALALAGRKAQAAGAAVRFDQALGSALPYPDASFDRVVSSLVFHHLTPDDKRATLREIHRVLAPGGSFLLVDFGLPSGAWNRLTARLTRGERLGHNLRGLAPLLRDAGFRDVEELGAQPTLAHTVRFQRATR
jgi:ubiquinone/menaquinone biosynthesis C-methylase UbiE